MRTMLQLLGVFVLALSATAATIDVAPSALQIELGDLFTVDVNVTGLGDGVAPSLGAYQLDFQYDDTLLSFVDVTFGDQLSLNGVASIAFFIPGVGSAVSILESSFNTTDELNDGQLGNFRLFTISFTALSVGVSPLTLDALVLSDADFPPADITTAFSVTNSQVQITDPGVVIPEPSTVLMLATGLAAVLVIRWRLRSKLAAPPLP